MSKAVAEGLFLLAILAPPLIVAACALVILVKAPAERRSGTPIRSAPLTH
jgi:hypothetical protein